MSETDRDRLESLLDARHPCVAIPTYEEEHALMILRRIVIDRGTSLRIWNSSIGVHEGLIGDREAGATDTESPAGGLYYLLSKPVAGVTVLMDVLGHLDDPRVMRLLRDLIESHRAIRGHLVLIDHSDSLPDAIAHVATRFNLSLPEEEELRDLVLSTVRREHREGLITEARLSREALGTIVRNLRGLTRRQAEQIIVDALASDRRLSERDINTILARKRQVLHKDGLLEYVEAPVSLDEVAGMERLKRWLAQRERSFEPEAAAYGLKPPRGLLMLGVPGAGKSFCAKAVATAWKRPLLRLDPSVLFDRYIGESERRLRDALQQAEVMSPIILWVDEIEKGFASAASRSVDGGLSQRMFGTLLTWMQEHTAPVFLIATANNIDALPAELLRKGRFDEIFFVDLPEAEARRAIFRIHLSRRRVDVSGIDLDALAGASDGYTGAEIEQAVIAAMHEAFASNGDPDTASLLRAMEESPPLSVTMAEYVHNLRDWARDRCISAD